MEEVSWKYLCYLWLFEAYDFLKQGIFAIVMVLMLELVCHPITFGFTNLLMKMFAVF